MLIKASASAFALAGFLCASPALYAKPIKLPKSETIRLPAGTDLFAGPNADAINGNCLACHSRDMILMQPNMSKAAWQAEVAKMSKVYKAPVQEADVPAIVDYLVKIKGVNEAAPQK